MRLGGGGVLVNNAVVNQLPWSDLQRHAERWGQGGGSSSGGVVAGGSSGSGGVVW